VTARAAAGGTSRRRVGKGCPAGRFPAPDGRGPAGTDHAPCDPRARRWPAGRGGGGM